MSKVLIFTATYEEVENIGAWIRETAKACPDTDILIVDDSSPDGTGELISDLQVAFPQITLITRAGKTGLNTAHVLAMAYASEHEYDVLVTMDADGSHQPRQIPLLLERLQHNDVDFVIGTRSAGGTHQAKLSRRVLSRGANTAARVLLPVGITEYTTSFRAFNPTALDVLNRAEFSSSGYAFFIECIEILHRAGVRFAEVPIDFMDRTGGRSKIPKSQIFSSMIALVLLAVSRRFAESDQKATSSLRQ
ncbi:MAG TPA: dolichol-phosphate mannosyltransferase [Actinobacteria bacterium]|nr:dolichol-phosphate mannosyltransferase [Actinomycetota bacterium]